MRGSVQFVTAARDIKDVADAPDLARRLTLVGRDGQFVEGPLAVIQFSVPHAGVASPIRRSDPDFSGHGRTAGPETWEAEYMDPSTGTRWIMDFPHAEYHGGGPPRLRKVASAADEKKKSPLAG